ncbi:MAG TPA: CTP synthase, partial [Candidatus Saccharimonadales bacterium]|nr:CTP synthase [Candidatus Saccharimonadales bacterium]
PKHKPKLQQWRNLVSVIKQPDRPVVRIGVVAKYMDHEDTYTSVFEAIKSAAWANQVEANIVWVDAEKLEDDENLSLLDEVDAIVVPGGFGPRGVEGKIRAARYAMRQGRPYLGLCLGMQTAVIAVARQALGTDAVNSTEMDPGVQHPVIALMADQADVTDKGGTMRLGDYPCVIDKKSLSYRVYGTGKIKERHRHRYEFNNAYRETVAAAGLRLVGLSPDKRLVELVELEGHPFFVASQYHPEYKSRPNRPHPLFNALIEASLQKTDRAARKASNALTP